MALDCGGGPRCHDARENGRRGHGADRRGLSVDQLAERTLGGDRGIAKPLMTSNGQAFDLLPVQKKRIKKTRRQRQRWQRRASRRKKGSRNQKKTYRKAARY